MMQWTKDMRGTGAENDLAMGMARELPSFWLAELAAGRGSGPVPAAVARHELDRRDRAAQETMCRFLDALSARIGTEPTAVL